MSERRAARLAGGISHGSEGRGWQMSSPPGEAPSSPPAG